MFDRDLIRTGIHGTPMVLQRAKSFIRVEATALIALADRLTEELCIAASEILASQGKVILCGVGKSKVIGEKISATMASTGTPSFPLDPTDAVHGDLGRISPTDIIILLSNSGETQELLRVVEFVKRIPIKIIVMTGNRGSTLARQADIVLDIGQQREACPLGLAPTTSTTAMMALGDALALIVLEQRGFTREDFARLHPGGALGEKSARLR